MTIDPDNQRNGDWIQTYTGRAFHYEDFSSGDICIEDIAHSLSMECRYGGHTAWHYSVAQHSVHLYDALLGETGDRVILRQGLLHDAPEAYAKDIPRPLKALLGEGYKHLDSLIWAAICNKYKIPFELPKIVKEIDLRLALDEKRALLCKGEKEWAGISASFKPIWITIPEWSPSRAKTEFMNRFRQEFGVHEL